MPLPSSLGVRYGIAMSRRILLPFLTILFLSGATFGSLLLSSSPTSWDDGLRHITMARVMREEGIDQTWDRFLFGGYLAEHPLDPWFLADVSYIPFTAFPDALGLKLYATLGIAALLLALWYIIAPMKLPAPWVTALLLLVFVMQGFYGRLVLARPFVWSTVFSLLALDAVLRRRWVQLTCVLLIATLFSQLFVFPLLLALSGVAWLLSLRDRRAAITATTCIALGVLAGVALHPHPVSYVLYIVAVFLRIPFEARSLNLGTEMYPGFLSATAPTAILGSLVLICTGAHTEGHKIRLRALHEDGTTLLAALTACAFFAYLFAWNRMIDLLLPLLIFLCARVLKHIEPFAKELFTVSLAPLLPRIRGGTLLLATLFAAALCTIGRAAAGLYTTAADRVLAHAAPLAAIPAGSRVLNPEWFLFPLFMHGNPHVRYATGIDNTFMAVTNRSAYQLLEVTFSPAATLPRAVVDTRAWIAQLLEHFPSDYLVLSNGWGKNLLPLLRETPGLTELTESGAKIEVFEIGEDFGEQ